LTQPDLTVFIPTYNRSHFLRECLAALLDQGLPPSEFVVLVSDNASTDDTKMVAERFGERLQVRYHRRSENVGHVANLNGAAELVTTPYVAFLCDDDLVSPGQLGRAMTCLRARPRACLFAALGLAQTRFGDGSTFPLGRFIDVEAVDGEPFLFRWSRAAWLAACSLHTPMTIIGSVFRLASIPQRPLFLPDFPQESDRMLFLGMADAGEIYSAPWIGGHLRYHDAQQTLRNPGGSRETRRVTRRALDRARELDCDLASYWIERIPDLGLSDLEFVCGRIGRHYPDELRTRILDETGARRRLARLHREKRRMRRASRRRRGVIDRLRYLLEK
jgi:glycosyltransferase involved in cell wall biosynthesis